MVGANGFGGENGVLKWLIHSSKKRHLPTIRTGSPDRWPLSGKVSQEAYLLPFLDEYTVAYKDRSALADPELMEQIDAASPVGILGPVIVMDGRIVGIWKRTMKKNKMEIETQSLHPKRPEGCYRGRRALWYVRRAAGYFGGVHGGPAAHRDECVEFTIGCKFNRFLK